MLDIAEGSFEVFPKGCFKWIVFALERNGSNVPHRMKSGEVPE